MFEVHFMPLFRDEGFTTLHSSERRERVLLALDLIKKEDAILVDSFFVDKGHKNGPEIHNIYSNGVIFIYNEDTHKLITALIGRPQQYKRYYEITGIADEIDPNTVDMCRTHQFNGLNTL